MRSNRASELSTFTLTFISAATGPKRRGRKPASAITVAQRNLAAHDLVAAIPVDDCRAN